MTWAIAALKQAASELPAEKLAEFLGELETAKAIAWSRLIVPAQPAHDEKLLDAEELAPIIDRPAWSVRDLARRGVIPAIKIGRLVKFRASAVVAALEAGQGAGHRIINPARAEKRSTRKGRCPSGVQVESAPEVPRG